MKLALVLLLLLVPLAVVPLGELPDNVDALTSSEMFSEESEDLTEDVTSPEEDGPTPPSFVAAPLDPLPSMSVPLARPPGFRPPTSFKQKKGESQAVDNVNVGFVVRRGRAKVMGFSRRKTDDSE